MAPTVWRDGPSISGRIALFAEKSRPDVFLASRRPGADPHQRHCIPGSEPVGGPHRHTGVVADRLGCFWPLQAVTYASLHGSISHLAFNMFGLWMFGADLERVWGPKRLLMLYVVSVLGAAVAKLGVATMSGSVYPTVGASGGLFGILVAFAMVFPHARSCR